MHKVVKKSEAVIRVITNNKLSLNFITKSISPDVSFAITVGKNYSEEEVAKYNRIYYVLEGELHLKFGEEQVSLNVGDSCYVEKETQYTMSGTFRVIVVNQPAFGT